MLRSTHRCVLLSLQSCLSLSLRDRELCFASKGPIPAANPIWTRQPRQHSQCCGGFVGICTQLDLQLSNVPCQYTIEPTWPCLAIWSLETSEARAVPASSTHRVEPTSPECLAVVDSVVGGQAGTVVMGTTFPTPYEALVDRTRGLSSRLAPHLYPPPPFLRLTLVTVPSLLLPPAACMLSVQIPLHVGSM